MLTDLGIQDLLPRQQAEHLRQRRAYWEARVDGAFRYAKPVGKLLVAGHWCYVEGENNDEVLWMDPEPVEQKALG